jgi:hypothetical protein
MRNIRPANPGVGRNDLGFAMGVEIIDRLLHLPLIVFAASIVLLFAATYGGYLLRPRGHSEADRSADLDTAHGAALTLLALVIGFTFSLAAGRYDQRKNYEEAEANAIGTEYSRASLLPSMDAATVQQLLRTYLSKRIAFYEATDESRLKQIAAETSLLQAKLWSAVSGPASARPNPVTMLAVSGMNDVINSEGYTNAAWLYRVPPAAWVLMEAIAVICAVLFGYRFRRDPRAVLFIFPAIAAFSFFVVSDIDNPRRGVIRVVPENLILTLNALR